MSRILLPFHSDDISALARSLKGQLANCEPQPTHLELLNMLVRANGYRNFQHYRAELAARDLLENRPPAPGPAPGTAPESAPESASESAPGPAFAPSPEPAPERAANPEPVDFARVKRLLRMFDSEEKLVRWPSKRSQQELCLWVIWSKLPAGQVITEKEINRLLNDSHLFGDHPLLRRWLCDYGMVSRTRDGREYRRVEKRPPAEALELIRQLRSARAG